MNNSSCLCKSVIFTELFCKVSQLSVPQLSLWFINNGANQDMKFMTVWTSNYCLHYKCFKLSVFIAFLFGHSNSSGLIKMLLLHYVDYHAAKITKFDTTQSYTEECTTHNYINLVCLSLELKNLKCKCKGLGLVVITEIHQNLSPKDFVHANRGGKRGGRQEGASQKVFEIGRNFSGKSYALCRILWKFV